MNPRVPTPPLFRRRFLQLAASALPLPLLSQPHTLVPNSAGTAPPLHKAPPHACDCHMHIYDPDRFPFAPSTRIPPQNAALPQYRLLQNRLGTSRAVIVTPRNYATDNRATLDAIAQLGRANARGVAVLRPTVTPAELRQLHDAGIRGIRFSLNDPATAVVTPDMIEPLSKRTADLGWHVQLYLDGDQIVALHPLLRRLPSPIVFDHLAHPPLPAAAAHPSHRLVLDLLEKHRAWVKLSGAYLNSSLGPPSFPEAAAIARSFVHAAPERLVWGSDWPHPTAPPDHKPDDAALFDLLAEWAPSESIRHRILVDNPEQLYGFKR